MKSTLLSGEEHRPGGWLALSYTVPSELGSSVRVTAWRRLRRQGAISPLGGFYLLPRSEEAAEAFDWLAGEIRSAGGETLVWEIERFEGEAEREIIQRFREARDADYYALAEEAGQLSAEAVGARPPSSLRERLARLRRRYAEIERIDFFQASGAEVAAAALERVAGLLRSPGPVAEVDRTDPKSLRGRPWVTRPHPHVDRLACVWLIRRFIDAEAVIRYSNEPAEGEIAFDMPGAAFGHHDSRCSFETMIVALDLGPDPALDAIAEIVHEIDLKDGASAHPEVEGVETILQGWRAAGFSDAELERHGVALFEGLYRGLASGGRKASEAGPEESTGGGE